MHRTLLVEKLKKDLAEGRVVTIAGTGVAVAACQNQDVGGYPVATWTGLLRHGAQHCGDLGEADEKAVRRLNEAIGSGEIDFLTGAAETISGRLKRKGEGVFLGWLRDTVGQLRVKDGAILEALDALPGIFATLNYDGLIEKATQRQAITWCNPDKTQQVLRQEIAADESVLHLHGWFEESESVVLGLSSYLTAGNDPHARAVLQSLCIDRVMLFVGCGDTVLDPNFARLIEWGKEALAKVAPRHYLLCRTSEVAAFQHKLRDAPWLQPLDYGVRHEDLAPFLRSLVPAADRWTSKRRRDSKGPGFDLDAYRRTMRKHYGRLKLEELDPTTGDVPPLTLTSLFIAPNARECVEFMPRVFELPKEVQRRLREAGEIEGREIDEETLQQHRRAYAGQSSRPILDLVNDPAFSRLVVLGDPGSGKSTLLQYLVLRWTELEPSALGHDPLPIIIPLGEYARLRHEGHAVDFLSYLNSGASARWHFEQHELEAWLLKNASLLLFDGLDEVFDPLLRKEVCTAIHRFADDYPLACVVVTSRIIGFHHQVRRDERFRHVVLEDLDDAQIAEFISHWHRAAYDDPAAGEKKRVLLGRAIEDFDAIRQLAGNPLLLTMMAILNRTQDLPRDRAELYEQCARLLLHQWKVDLAFTPYPELAQVSLDFKDKRNLLLRVARTMLTREEGLAGNLIEEAALESTLAAGLAGMPNLRADRAARALIEQLRGRNFMLCSVGGGCYAFVHRTFLEFFCALEIRTQFESEQSLTLEDLRTGFFGRWRDETWHEVLCLLSGMIAPHHLVPIFEWLLIQPDLSGVCHHVFLAARCIGEVRNRAELAPVEIKVQEATQALAHFNGGPYYEPWEGWHNLIMLVQLRAVDTVARVWRNQNETRLWLKDLSEYGESESVRWSALQALARGWKEHPETLPFLKAHVHSDHDLVSQRGAVEMLVHDWKDDVETLSILKKCAKSDDYWAARGIALEALLRDWKSDPETLSIVKACAISARLTSVRCTALEALARDWKDDPVTLPILKEYASSDEREDLCLTALELLGRGWQDNPETRSILQACAMSDERESLRVSALASLVEGWKYDPETLPILQACAKSEEHETLRQRALEILARDWKEDAQTLPLIRSCLESDAGGNLRESALKALVHGWKHDPDTLSCVKTRAQSDDDESVRRISLEALVRGWKEDPATWLILKTIVRSDPDWEVRQSALEHLVRGWKHNPETLPTVRALAQSDDDESVRKLALEALAHGWKEDPVTRSILKTSAQSDPDGGVRANALEALVSGWKQDPETLQILKARLKVDEDEGVLQVALKSLARVWRDDPETLIALEEHAKSGHAWNVRHCAAGALARGWQDYSAAWEYLDSVKKRRWAGRC